MNAWHWIAGALLVAGTGVLALAVLGLLIARDVFDRLHLIAPAGVLGAQLACAAVVVNEGWSPSSLHAVMIGAVLLLTNPVLTHATALAARLRRTGHIPVLPSELREARERR
jgi:multisubunit Na+/H+ antiporter MnhG subunit